MPKQSSKKRTTNATAKPSAPKPRKRAAAKKAKPAMAAGSAGIVRICIAGCAGSNDFGPNDQLRNIPADPPCVQTCIFDQTGTPIVVTSTDTEISLNAKLGLSQMKLRRNAGRK
jgi:hypothetical protein